MGRYRILSLWLPVWLYMAAIFALSSQPAVPISARIDDKALHGAAYAGLAVTVSRAMAGGWARSLPVPRMAAAIVVTTGYGISDEWHQSFVPGRSADVYDVYADAVGALVGAGVSWAWSIIGLRSSTVDRV